MGRALVTSVVGLVVAGALLVPVAAAQDPFSATPSTITFRTPPGEVESRTVTITNTSGRSVRIDVVSLLLVTGALLDIPAGTTPDACFSQDETGGHTFATLTPGESCLLDITFGPGSVLAQPTEGLLTIFARPLDNPVTVLVGRDLVRIHGTVIPVPASKEQCIRGGWRTFAGFNNQGDCVSFVATSGKNPPSPG